MQDEINEKVIALSIRTTKLTAEMLQKSIRFMLSQIKKQLDKPVQHHGKQTLKQLMKQNAGVSSIEITDSNIKAFESTAKKYGVEVHGWINPFRVSHKNDPSLLSAKNPAKLILDSGNADGDVCILPNGIYYNPASPAVHARIISGVKEILGKYDIAGIHIDDYFYPSTDKSVDEKQYSAYTAKGGKLSLKDWRI